MKAMKQSEAIQAILDKKGDSITDADKISAIRRILKAQKGNYRQIVDSLFPRPPLGW